ncbi:MAG: TetR/AcrR family transcriptional regulator C-terminal domain-containing protein [Treponema sp.]|jgi:AcrR family transcriptional regulator|nr:TetR/AcrR family transcriptional regulator C-terminal domain-containing protein [Treponema sp.]
MKKVQNNRGACKTKNAIRNSLIELMKQKAVARITVTEICRKADIHRTTFYAHYRDQYDLLDQMEKEAMTSIDNLLDENKLVPNCGDGQIAAMAEDLLRHIAVNNNSVQALLSRNGDIFFQKKLISCLILHLRQIEKKYSGDTADDKKNLYYSVFLVHGAIALIQLWLKNNMDMPVPEIADMLLKITRKMP